MIENVLKLVRRSKQEAEGLDVFTRLLLASTIENSLDGVDQGKVAQFAQEAFLHLLRKPHKRHAIALRQTELLAGTNGRAGPSTVVDILNDDMPYVVDSVMGEFQARGIAVRLVFHPVFKVTRYGSGRLTAVVGGGDTNWASGNQESFVCVVAELLEPAAAQALVVALDGVLDDVRHAAGDGEAMRVKIGQAISAYETMQIAFGKTPGAPAPFEVKEAVEFLRWLGRGNFTMLGMRDYEFVGTDNTAELWPMSSGALGVFRTPEFTALRRGAVQLQITPEIRAFYNSPSPLIITKANAQSRVRRRLHLDYIGVKRYSQSAKLLGEVRVVGLFTPAAYLHQVASVPWLRQKIARVQTEAGFAPDSYNGRALIDALEMFPRDELFQLGPDRLKAWALALVDLDLRPRLRVLSRRDEFGRYYSILVYVPRDLYSGRARERIGAYLASRFKGRIAAFYPFISAGPLVRTQFIIALEGESPVDVAEEVLEHDIAELLLSWNDRLARALVVAEPTRPPAAMIEAYGLAFPADYAETFPVERAVADIKRIARLGPGQPVAIDFYREPAGLEHGNPAHRVRAAVYRFDEPIPLSQRVPLLENLGFRVIDERSYKVHPVIDGRQRTVMLHDMTLETADGMPIDLSLHDTRVEAAFLAAFHGEADNDPFNALVIAAGLAWRQVAVLRAYAAYLRQIRAPFGQRYVAETLVRHPAIAADLYGLFNARFETASGADATARQRAMLAFEAQVRTALARVQGLDEDRVLRRILDLVLATVRTTALVLETAPDGQQRGPEAIAFKIDSKRVDALPQPRPLFEIFVYSPRVEGIHLRFAPIARGGIRWSDRPQDFRTEVLGLAKAQQVKNTVIVPSGAKGGFVPKLQRRNATREEVQAEGIACYRIFITALLSLTDNIKDGAIVPPRGLVRHDGDDPYLVVAADKGTATFSDDANAIAVKAGFWLGDAFASGGSVGYDHKRMGITARGAWECVKRHFREIDIDIQAQTFSAIGVGDMSGDVFGNAMLLSTETLLVAAFDHRDIFIDPTPDLARSFAERKRLFGLPRSSWADYDRAVISAGGGVFPRAGKAIALTPQIKALFGLSVDQITPDELIEAILRADVDLMWFGGIGTFIRASDEVDEQVGDRANHGVRIAASQLRVKVIGEGANLGLTQRARIEAARLGVRLNTDFIDNSAGVNTSDQEVNIKIALQPAIATGRLSREDRNGLLASMAPDVAAAVLVNNYQQGLALSLAERTSTRDIAHLGRLSRVLDERGLIDRKLEALPSGAEFAARAAAGGGVTRPELAVLLSWSKIALSADLLAGPVPDDPSSASLLLEYFPAALRERFEVDVLAHRLRREIIATRITNSIINRGGPAVMVRLGSETGRATADIARAFMAARTIFGLPELWAQIDALDGQVGGQLQLELYQGLQDLLVEQTGQLLARQGQRALGDLVALYRPAASRLWQSAGAVAAPTERKRLDVEHKRLMDAGVGTDLAARLVGIGVVARTFWVADRAMQAGSTPEETARIMFASAEFLRFDELKGRAQGLSAADEFDRRAIDDAMAAFEAAGLMLTERMLIDQAARTQEVGQWVATNMPGLAAAKPIIDTILSHAEITIPRLTVAASGLRDVDR